MEDTNAYLLIAVLVAVGIILRPEIALTSLGALTVINAPFVVVATPYGLLAVIPIVLVGAMLIGFGDMVKNSRKSAVLRKQQHDEPAYCTSRTQGCMI